MDKLFFFFLAILTVATVSRAEKRVVCYYGSWSVYRPGNGKFDISNIDPTLCTHLIYTFVGLDGEEIRILDAWQDLPDDGGKDGFRRFNALRQKSPNTKTLVAIGGWNEGSEKYSRMASTVTTRERFTKNAIAFVKKYNFDGFDIDWEYPAQRGGAREDFKNYIELLKVLKREFQKENLILSAAVVAAEASASQSFDIPQMSKYLDFINIMAYDLHGAWDSKTGMNAALKPAASESGSDLQLNVLACVTYWLKAGAPKEKLNLGVPFYGRAFTLANAQQNKVGHAARGAGAAGPYTREPGMLGYNEICEMHLKKDWNIHFDEERRVPYAYKGEQWVGYDDERSMSEKADLIRQLDLGGAMVWSIETDDFLGICGGKYPLLKTLNNVLKGGSQVVPGRPVNTPAPEKWTTPQPNKPTYPVNNQPTTPKSGGQFVCTRNGIFSDPNSCGFIRCIEDRWGRFTTYFFECARGLCYRPDVGVCDWIRP